MQKQIIALSAVLGLLISTVAASAPADRVSRRSAPNIDERTTYTNHEGANGPSAADVSGHAAKIGIAFNVTREGTALPASGATTSTPLMVARRRSRDKIVTIDGVRYRDHGTKDVRRQSKVEIEADNYYFKPTFLRGNPGQKLTVVIENEQATLHNFFVPALGVDKQLPPNSKVEVQLTFPDSGVLTFTCKYHAALGMNGQLKPK